MIVMSVRGKLQRSDAERQFDLVSVSFSFLDLIEKNDISYFLAAETDFFGKSESSVIFYIRV